MDLRRVGAMYTTSWKVAELTLSVVVQRVLELVDLRWVGDTLGKLQCRLLEISVILQYRNWS